MQRYYEAGIPVKYWHLEMDASFRGDKVLMTKYQEITQDLKVIYAQGLALCLAGGLGLGKTMTATNVLKRALEKGYKAIYVNLNDIISFLISNQEERAAVRHEFLTTDFLVIDEFDPRYIGSDAAAEMFGRILEDILRIRLQNTLPIIICTNSLNPLEAFKGPLKNSLGSLFNYFVQVSVLGKDLRKEKL